MVFLQMDIVRIIQIYVVQLGMGIIYIIFGLLILKRDTKRLNQIFSTFYLLAGMATIINIVYASLELPKTVKILHILTVGLFLYAPLYLLVFCLIILKSEKVVSIKTHNILAIVYLILIVILGLIGYFYNGVTIDESTGWKPVWSLTFLIYSIIILTLYIIIPVFYMIYRIYQSFEDNELKKRWLYFALGVFPYFAIFVLTSFSNFLNDPTFRLITSIAGLSLFATAFLLYYGVGRQIEKK